MFWLSCQIDRSHLFQCHSVRQCNTRDYRVLRLTLLVDSPMHYFTIEREGETDRARGRPALANVLDTFVLLIGGTKDKSVSRVTLGTYEWSKMPELNVYRTMASACTLGADVYVLGGFGERHATIGSLEKLSSAGDSCSLEKSWLLIELPSWVPSRADAVFAPLNGD